MKYICEDINGEINGICNEFTKSSFFARYYLINKTVNLHNNNLSKVKEDIFMIEHALEPMKASAYLTIGNSFMFKDYQKSISYLTKSLELYDLETQKKPVIDSINFVNILHGYTDNYIDNDSYSNFLFKLCKEGSRHEAQEIIKKIKFEELTDIQKAFNCYYRGLLYKSEEILYESLEYFYKCEEKFYKLLPILELERLGEKEYKIKALKAM
jgi:tetratricopeptide (TPR) repeat protein